jgi:UDP-GlcNAc:undecaprenyl-phosphate GlcNAc-1-phosphate transferase
MLGLIPWLVAAALLSALLLNVLSRTALAKHFADMPGHRKVHQRAVPRLGGIGIVLSFLILVTAAHLLGFWNFPPRFLLSVVFTSLFVLVAGALDDVLSLGYRSKFLLQFLLAGIVICVFGFYFDHLSLFGLEFSLGGFGMVVSIFWMVGLMNAVNLIDGIDGLAGGVAIAGFTGVAVLAYSAGVAGTLGVCALLGGAILGFLYYNFQDRRKIFLGDTGSQFLGAMLALLTINIQDTPGVGRNMLIPLLLVGYPLLDVSVAMVRRFLWVRNRELGQRILRMFHADSDHMHHRLLNAGLSHVQASALLVSLASGFTAAAVLLSRVDWVGELAVTAYLLVAVGFLLNRLRFLPAHKVRRALRVWFLGEGRAEGDRFGSRYARYYEIFASADPATQPVRHVAEASAGPSQDGAKAQAIDVAVAPTIRTP